MKVDSTHLHTRPSAAQAELDIKVYTMQEVLEHIDGLAVNDLPEDDVDGGQFDFSFDEAISILKQAIIALYITTRTNERANTAVLHSSMIFVSFLALVHRLARRVQRGSQCHVKCMEFEEGGHGR